MAKKKTKLRWRLDKEVNQLYISRKVYGSMVRVFQITENEFGPLWYNLFSNKKGNGVILIGQFRKLKDVKSCAQLIHNG